MTPPREPVRLLRHVGGIKDGARVSLRVGPWPFSLGWELAHRDYRFWKHVHRMVPQGPDACLLEDTIEYELPTAPSPAMARGSKA